MKVLTKNKSEIKYKLGKGVSEDYKNGMRDGIGMVFDSAVKDVDLNKIGRKWIKKLFGLSRMQEVLINIELEDYLKKLGVCE
jgi:hypothetical protein